MHKLAMNSPPTAEVHDCDAQNSRLYLGFVVFEIFFIRHPHI